MHQSIVIDNRPGASSMIGMDVVARADPDGYTILVNASLHIIVPAIVEKVIVDPITAFEPVTQLGTVPLIMVVSKDSRGQDRCRYCRGGEGAAWEIDLQLFGHRRLVAPRGCLAEQDDRRPRCFMSPTKEVRPRFRTSSPTTSAS